MYTMPATNMPQHVIEHSTSPKHLTKGHSTKCKQDLKCGAIKEDIQSSNSEIETLENFGERLDDVNEASLARDAAQR